MNDKVEIVNLKNQIRILESKLKEQQTKAELNESLFKSEKSMNDTLKQFNIMAFTQVKDLADENQNLYKRNAKLKLEYSHLLERYENNK
ncbi:MAG: hypothetical protein ACXAAH_05955 [Promethearchaeota archaeon]|jgi:hypothetical protein